MRCVSCGAEVPDGVKFCPACGAAQPESSAPPPPPPPPQYSYQAPTTAPNAPAQQKPKTAGQIVFSIINLLCCPTCINQVMGLIALILSIMAGSAKTYEDGVQKLKTAKTLNIIAIIIGVIGTGILLALYGAYFWSLIQSGDWSSY